MAIHQETIEIEEDRISSPDVIEKAELYLLNLILLHKMSQPLSFKAAMLGSGNFLVILTGLILAALLSRILTMDAYAAYRQTMLVYAFVAPFMTLGLPQALNFFIPRDRINGRSILSGNLLLLFSMGVLFAVIIWCGGNEFLSRRFNNTALSRLLLIYSPYGILAFPVAAISACLIACNRVKGLTIYNIIRKLTVLVCVLGMTIFWRSPDAAVSGTVVAALIVSFPAVILTYRAFNRLIRPYDMMLEAEPFIAEDGL